MVGFTFQALNSPSHRNNKNRNPSSGDIGTLNAVFLDFGGGCMFTLFLSSGCTPIDNYKLYEGNI